ncbi:MAG: hypothetical protein ACK4NR_11640 [Micavibrio sp.]
MREIKQPSDQRIREVLREHFWEPYANEVGLGIGSLSLAGIALWVLYCAAGAYLSGNVNLWQATVAYPFSLIFIIFHIVSLLGSIQGALFVHLFCQLKYVQRQNQLGVHFSQKRLYETARVVASFPAILSFFLSLGLLQAMAGSLLLIPEIGHSIHLIFPWVNWL